MAAQRLRAAWHSTPGRLTAIMVGLIAVAIAFGVTGVDGATSRGSQVTSVRTSSGPLTVAAQQLYRSLSDADATAAAAFLSSGGEPPALRTRYLTDIASASASLVDVSEGSNGTADGKTAQALATIAAGLPVYTGLIETARADNRQGFPVGAAYLREASGLMQHTLLLSAASLYGAETARLADDSGSAAGYPWLAVPLGVLALIGLFRAQRYLTRRTNRVLNLGLVATTVAVMVSLVWINVAWYGVHTHLRAAHDKGSAQVELLSQARIAALQGRTDEALTLVARGSGGAYEKDFSDTMSRLIGKDGRGGLLAAAYAESNDPAVRDSITKAVSDLEAWQKIHVTLRADDDSGDNLQAVGLAVGTGATDTPAPFNLADGDLNAGITRANAMFDDESAAAAKSLRGLAIAIALLTAAAVAAAAIGFQRRIAEYR